MSTKESSNKADSKNRLMNDVRALARILRQFDLSGVEIETEDVKIELKRQASAVAPPVFAQRPVDTPERPAVDGAKDSGVTDSNNTAEPEGETITSPFVGTFYRSPSPEAPPFVDSGQTVRKGQTLCIVEAMKLMNEIEAEFDFKVVETLAKNGEPVEYGQALFRISRL